VHVIVAVYNAALAIIWAALLTRWSFAPGLFLAHAAAVAMPWLIARSSDRLTPMGRVLLAIYPLIWILPLWTELDFLRHLLHTTSFDAPVAALDLAVFRVHLDEVWIYRLPAVWFSELMHAAYFAYYLTVIVPLLYVIIARRGNALYDMTLRVTLVYLACYAVYIAFPVDGPHFLSEHYSGPLTDGFFYKLVRSFQESGDSLGCSFPSFGSRRRRRSR
jgi:hypothetical protein